MTIRTTIRSAMADKTFEQKAAYGILASMMAIQYYKTYNGGDIGYFPRKIGNSLGLVIGGAVGGLTDAAGDIMPESGSALNALLSFVSPGYAAVTSLMR